MNELVSIIMPSYNTAQYIAESIESVLAQTYTNWELIIVADCSSDNTDEIVMKFDDKRIKYLKNEINSGAAVSRNRALKEAGGKWIAFLDSDDLWYPEKLEKQIKFMTDNDYHFSYTEYERFNENEKEEKNISGPKKIGKLKMHAYCWQGCVTVMYDREKVGLIQIADLKKNNDYAMWLKVIKKTDCHLLKEVLCRYRKRSGSISSASYKKLIKSHYTLYRVGENKNSVSSFLYTVHNLFWGVYKKIRYEKNKGELK